jgi:nitrogen fixation/metabolism regulation signal transduction histidine kinase
MNTIYDGRSIIASGQLDGRTVGEVETSISALITEIERMDDIQLDIYSEQADLSRMRSAYHDDDEGWEQDNLVLDIQMRSLMTSMALAAHTLAANVKYARVLEQEQADEFHRQVYRGYHDDEADRFAASYEAYDSTLLGGDA